MQIIADFHWQLKMVVMKTSTDTNQSLLEDFKVFHVMVAENDNICKSRQTVFYLVNKIMAINWTLTEPVVKVNI